MSLKWFVLMENITYGPFSTEEAEGLIDRATTPALVWWRGQSDWIPPDQWRSQREKVEAEARQAKEKSWKVKGENGEELGPFNEEQLIEELRKHADFTNIEIWTEGLVQWEPVYNVHQFMDSLGVCRRKHPRVPINAQIHLTDRDLDTIAVASTISEGGLGLENGTGLELGKKLSVVVKSPDISIPIRATAAVVYIAPDGRAGLRFDYIMPECKAAIIEYVKRETGTMESAA